MDANIFTRIAAAVALIATGSIANPEYAAHLKAIDDHLQSSDAKEVADQSDDQARLDTIEKGLGQIADTVAPGSAAAAGIDTTGGPVDTTVVPAAAPAPADGGEATT